MKTNAKDGRRPIPPPIYVLLKIKNWKMCLFYAVS